MVVIHTFIKLVTQILNSQKINSLHLTLFISPNTLYYYTHARKHAPAHLFECLVYTKHSAVLTPTLTSLIWKTSIKVVDMKKCIVCLRTSYMLQKKQMQSREGRSAGWQSEPSGYRTERLRAAGDGDTGRGWTPQSNGKGSHVWERIAIPSHGCIPFRSSCLH